MSIVNKTSAKPLAKSTMVVGTPPKPKGKPKPSQRNAKPKKRSVVASTKN